MKARIVKWTAGLVLTLLASAPAAAQLRFPPVTLVAGVGHLDRADLGWHHFPAGDSGFVSQNGARAWSLGVETRTPLRGVDLRLGVQRAHATSYIGYGNARPGELTSDQVTNWTADAVIRLPHVLDARPYLLGGAALTHIGFGSRSGSSLQGPPPEPFTDLSMHLGAGLAWTVGRYDLFVEASRISTRYPLGPDGQALGDASRINWSAGVRIPLHR